MRTTLLCMALLAVGCRIGLPIFDCSADSQCGAGARCIDGRCALPAKDCASGYKFYNSTQCVPVAGAPGDMSLDATGDMAMSQSDQGCDCPDMAQDMTATTFV